MSIHSDDCGRISVANVQVFDPSSVSSLKGFYAESFQ